MMKHRSKPQDANEVDKTPDLELRVVDSIPFPILERRIRDVRLLKRPDMRPYEDALITIERFRYENVRPTTKHVLTSGLETQRRLQTALAPLGYDQLELHEGIIVSESSSEVGIIPPIVELFEPEGDVPYVIDGAHRAFMGLTQGRDSFLGLFIRGIRTDCPSYAFPNEWDEIKEVKEKTEPSVWKNYRGDTSKGEHYNLYRDYKDLNGSVPRWDVGP